MLDSTKERYLELLRFHTTIDNGHGKLEVRAITTLATHNTDLLFPGVNQVALVTRTREDLKYGKVNHETLFLITNLAYDKLGPAELLQLKRDYWAVENKLHYRKDFVFGEDRSTIRKGHGPQNMATLRNFALGLLLANGIGNVKRCVDNLQHHPYSLLRKAA